MQDNLALFRVLVSTRTSRHVIGHLCGVSNRLVTAELRALRVLAPRLPHVAHDIAGAVVELMVAWLECSLRRSADDLADTFLQLTRALCANPVAHKT